MTPGRHCKAEMASLPNPNQLYTKILTWPRTTSHILQIWRAEQSPGKLYRQVTASYSEAPLGDRAGFVTQSALSDPLPSTLTTLYLESFRSEALSQPNAGHETKS